MASVTGNKEIVNRRTILENLISRRFNLAWTLAVAAAGFLVYANTLDHGFVWDDHVVIEANRFLQDGRWTQLLPGAGSAALGTVDGAARPVFLWSLLADRALWGGRPGGYHLTNAALHAANSGLVCAATAAALGPGAPALAAGLLFAVHPIHTEAVNLPTFRPDLLATFFGLLVLLLYLRASREEQRPLSRAALLVGAAALYGLALLAKEMAATVPLLALLCEEARGWRGGPRPSVRRRMLALALFTGVALGYAAFRHQRAGYEALQTAPTAASAPAPASPPVAAFPPKTYVPSPPQWSALYRRRAVEAMTMSGIFADDFRLLAWPRPLVADRPPRVIESPLTPRLWASWLLLASLLAAGVLAWRRRAAAVFLGLSWCFVSLLPVSNLAPLYNPIAERYLYMVSIGAVWLLARAAQKAADALAKHLGRRAAPAQAALVALLAGSWAAQTLARNRDWASDQALFAGARAASAPNARVFYNRGYLAQIDARWSEAQADYLQALALQPAYVEALVNLGVVYGAQGDQASARRAFERAIALKPKNAIPYAALAEALLKVKDTEGALRAYRDGLAVFPQDAEVWLKYGQLLLKKDPASAEAAFAEAERQDRRTAGRAEYGMGMAAMAIAEKTSSPEYYRKAQAHLTEAVKAEAREAEAELARDAGASGKTARRMKAARDAKAELNLGVAYHHLGNLGEAERLMRTALALAPGDAVAYYDFAAVRADQGDLNEARKLLTKAISLWRDYADAWYNLGVVDQQLGRVDEAVTAYKAALKASPGKLEPLSNLGGLYEQRGELALALDYDLQALAVMPRHPGVHNNLGTVYLKQGRIKEAEAEYWTVLDIYGPSEEEAATLAPTRVNLGICLYKEGRREEAIIQWRRSILGLPTYLNAYILLARAYRDGGDGSQAREVWRRVAELDPGNPEAQSALR